MCSNKSWRGQGAYARQGMLGEAGILSLGTRREWGAGGG